MSVIDLDAATRSYIVLCTSAAFFAAGPAHSAVSFPKITPHAPNTKQTPAPETLPFFDRVGQALWALGARFKENDLKYAVKAGMATAMLAAPAFFDATRPVFVEYKGEWALISVSDGLRALIGPVLTVMTVLCCDISNYWRSKC